MRIYVALKLNPRERTYLENGVGKQSLMIAQDLPESQRQAAFLQSEICFGLVPPAWLNQSQNLRWIQLNSVGFGKYQQLEPQVEFAMTNLRDFFTIPVAETALAGILALYRGMDRFGLEKQSKVWFGNDLRPGLLLLHQKKVLILGGGGNIGRYLIQLLEPFHAEVTVYGSGPHNADVYDEEGLDRVLVATDIVVNILPGTKKTEGLLDQRRLALLQPTALFINVGRGSVVDEAELVKLLRERKLGGALLDVSYQEPIPEDHPLWDLPNTILSQHTAGGYKDEIYDIVGVFLDNLRRFTTGEPLQNLVDLKKGY
jgi:glyoxylate/hydroxypyruvate reductase A